jgi:ABC-type sugar transport system substrate-binding protein
MKAKMIKYTIAGLLLTATAAHADGLADFNTKIEGLWKEATLGEAVEGVSNSGSTALKPNASIGAACLGSQITACVQWWAQLQDIAELTGWTVTEYDGKIDVATWNEQLTRAAQAGHDGILTFGAIPSISGQGLGAIEKSGLPLVGMTSDDPEGISSLNSRLDGGIYRDNYEVGYLQGVASYTLGSGVLHAIGGFDGSEISVARREGFEAFVAECTEAGGDCWAKLRQTDTAQMFQQIGPYCSSLALASPGFNVLITQVDDLTAICIDEVKGAGLLNDSVIGVGVDFNAVGVKRLSEGKTFQASVAAPYFSGAWQGVDELNRLMTGGTALEGRPWVKGVFHTGNLDLIDATSEQPWDVQLFDPEAAYSEAWGVSR